MKKILFIPMAFAAILATGCSECESWGEDVKGSYSGVTSCSGGTVNETIRISSQGGCDILVDDLDAEMTSANRFTIPSQTATLGPGVSGTVRGTGVISASGKLTITFNINSGQQTCTFTSN